MAPIQLKVIDTLIISMFALFIGHRITARVHFLEKYSIPQPVTGGVVVSVVVLLVNVLGGPSFVFDLELRDLLLLTFFSTIGLSAKLSSLVSGGRPLIVLTMLAGAFLVIQNTTGVAIAATLGAPHPGYGLFSGSISFAGGHGTAIAWGKEAEAAGLKDAAMLGIAFATFGLIAGGVVGGPMAEFLIKRFRLAGAGAQPVDSTPANANDEARPEPVSMDRIFNTIMVLAVCISFGEVVNRLFSDAGVKLPGFLTSMLVGIIITNFADVFRFTVRQGDFDRVGHVCLQLFLAMSLMSMDLNALSASLGPVLISLSIQVVVITSFAVFIVFKVMGADYDAAVISAGFTGLGLGATPVAIANMNAVTAKYGGSLKAFLVVPLVGAFFIDLMNAIVIKFFFALPIIQETPMPG